MALMDTPESLKLDSHDPRGKVQRRPSDEDLVVKTKAIVNRGGPVSSSTGRRRELRRDDDEANFSTIGAQCVGPSKTAFNDGGASSRILDYDSERRLVLLSGMPKLNKMQLDEETGSDSTGRQLDSKNYTFTEVNKRLIEKPADRRYGKSTKEVSGSREAAGTTGSGKVEFEIERLTDEIKRLELRLTDQVKKPTEERETSPYRETACIENRQIAEPAHLENRLNEKPARFDNRQSEKPARYENRPIAEPARSERRLREEPAHSENRQIAEPARLENEMNEKPSRLEIRLSEKQAHSNNRPSTKPARMKMLVNDETGQSLDTYNSRHSSGDRSSKRFHSKSHTSYREREIYPSDDDSDEQSVQLYDCRLSDSVLSSDEEMIKRQRRTDSTMKSRQPIRNDRESRRSKSTYQNHGRVSSCVVSSDEEIDSRQPIKSDRESRRKRDRSFDGEKYRKRPKAERQNKTDNRRRKDYLKLDRYDGSTALETFRIQFETCSEYNGWSEFDRLAQLKAALRGSAAQVLLGDGEPVTCQELWADLQQNFGTSGHEAQFKSQLKVRRRQKGESLRSLYQDINRLTLQAYPDSRGKLREKLAVEAFIVGLNNSELGFQVRNMSLADLQGAYRMALMLESNRSLVERADESKERKKDGRYDVSARAVAEDESDLIQRVRRLEERWSEQKAAQPEKKDSKDVTSIESKVFELERELDRVKTGQAVVTQPNVSTNRPHQLSYIGPVKQSGEQWTSFPAGISNSGPSREPARMNNIQWERVVVCGRS